MPPFPKPTVSYEYQVDAQINALRDWERTQPGRAIPARAAARVRIASWNIANLGVQERRDKDYRLIAELISWFDLVAVQEVHDDLSGIREVQGHLPASYRLLFSDASGNDERLTYLYDASRLEVLEEIGEVAPAPSTYRYIKLPGITQRFDGFDRNPYLASFAFPGFTFSLVNVHLYYGSESKIAMNRRSLETYAVARWADIRRKSPNAVTPHIMTLGDFNLPMGQAGDPVYDALTKRGLQLPPHSTQIGSSIASDATYDQIAFYPGQTQTNFVEAGVFDYDGAVFATLWDNHPDDFQGYLRYYISDHRPLWAVFQA